MADMITGWGFTNVFDIGSQDLPFPAGASGDAAVVEKATPKGEYLQLARYWSRASCVVDRPQRHVLTPGERQRLAFSSIRLMSSHFEPGSRLVVV